MKEDRLAKIKDFFAHELRRSRAEKGWSQAQAANELDLGERTYQKFEDPKELSCAFSKAVEVLDSFASISNYNFKDWFIKTCCPEDQGEIRGKFRWEEEIVQSLHEIKPAIRREFTKRMEKSEIKKMELILLVAVHLFSLPEEDIENYFAFIFLSKSKEELPKKVTKDYLLPILERMS